MNVVYANSTTSFLGPDGFIVSVNAGAVWAADDPIVKHRPDLFSKTPTYVHRSPGGGFVSIEQATAAPGEKRR